MQIFQVFKCEKVQEFQVQYFSLHREHPNASRMIKSEDKLKAILPNIVKREIKILLNPNRNSKDK